MNAEKNRRAVLQAIHDANTYSDISSMLSKLSMEQLKQTLTHAINSDENIVSVLHSCIISIIDIIGNDPFTVCISFVDIHTQIRMKLVSSQWNDLIEMHHSTIAKNWLQTNTNLANILHSSDKIEYRYDAYMEEIPLRYSPKDTSKVYVNIFGQEKYNCTELNDKLINVRYRHNTNTKTQIARSSLIGVDRLVLYFIECGLGIKIHSIKLLPIGHNGDILDDFPTATHPKTINYGVEFYGDLYDEDSSVTRYDESCQLDLLGDLKFACKYSLGDLDDSCEQATFQRIYYRDGDACKYFTCSVYCGILILLTTEEYQHLESKIPQPGQ